MAIEEIRHGGQQMKEYLSVRKHAWNLSLVFEAIYSHQHDEKLLHIKDWLLMCILFKT